MDIKMNTMNYESRNSMPTNMISYMKWTNSLKDTICQNSHKKKQTILKGLHLLKITESIINNVPIQKAPDRDGFTGEFHKTFKEEVIQILYNLLQRKYFLTHSVRLTLP